MFLRNMPPHHSHIGSRPQRIAIPNPTSSEQPFQPPIDSEYGSGSDTDEAPEGSGQVAHQESTYSSSPNGNAARIPRTSTSDAHAVHGFPSASDISGLRIEFDRLRSEQKVLIPFNVHDDPPRVRQADFPPSVSLKILEPIESDQIKNVIIVLHTIAGSKQTLKDFSKKIQLKYPESAFLLVRDQDAVRNDNSEYQWAVPGDPLDGTYLNACRVLLLDVVKRSLIAKCGFSPRDIMILGHGQGGMVALAAIAAWETVEFAGVVSIGGPMPDSAQLSSGAKSKTPALALGGIEGDINPIALKRLQKSFCHVTHNLRLTSQDRIPKSSEDLEPLLSFFAHRLGREEWEKQAILSLDGGGIRGYGTLLILKALMDKIGGEEKRRDREDGIAESSFSPCSYRPLRKSSASQASDSPTGSDASDADSFDSSPTDNLPNSSLYLPCHYFTYIAGTSTGGLISIMLSRFRMTVDECIAEYKTLGDKVFGHPRPFNKGGFPWHKFDYRVLEKVIKDVTERFCEESQWQVHFPLNEGFCRTIVTAYANHSKDPQIPYLFRSYGTPPAPYDRTKSIERQRTKRIHGPAPELPIWQVARATSAAPGYFPPITIQKGSGQDPKEDIKFKDGGFGTNNPSTEACQDVINKHGGSIKNIGVFVSIGTGVRDTPIFADRPGKWQDFKANLKGAIGQPSRTRGAHDNMATSAEQNDFQYYRFEGGDRLGEVALDEWNSHKFASFRGKNPVPGFKTIHRMDQATTWYLDKLAVQQDLDELAKLLVHRRRLRTRDVSAWDRYASASHYECTHKGCEHRRIDTADLYKQHLKEQHHFKIDDEIIERSMRKSRHCWTYRKPTTQVQNFTAAKSKGKRKASSSVPIIDTNSPSNGTLSGNEPGVSSPPEQQDPG